MRDVENRVPRTGHIRCLMPPLIVERISADGGHVKLRALPGDNRLTDWLIGNARRKNHRQRCDLARGRTSSVRGNRTVLPGTRELHIR